MQIPYSPGKFSASQLQATIKGHFSCKICLLPVWSSAWASLESSLLVRLLFQLCPLSIDYLWRVNLEINLFGLFGSHVAEAGLWVEGAGKVNVWHGFRTGSREPGGARWCHPGQLEGLISDDLGRKGS